MQTKGHPVHKRYWHSFRKKIITVLKCKYFIQLIMIAYILSRPVCIDTKKKLNAISMNNNAS